uniref:methyl-accepting chemotaxis protein n=1 Tax=Anaeromyxobacter oryzisoli TaxID=2925408 RepID=UPI001F595CA0
MRFTVGRKLAMLALTGLVLVLAGGITGYSGIGSLNDRMDEAVVYASALRVQGEIDMMHDAIRADVLALTVAGEMGDAERQRHEEAELREDARALPARLAELKRLPDHDIVRAVEGAEDGVRRFAAIAEDVGAQAARDRTGALARIPELDNAFDALKGPLGNLGERLEARAKAAQEEGDRADAAARSSLVAITIVSAMLLLGISLVITRGITRRLAAAVDVAQRIARGDLREAAVEAGGDEIAALQRAMRAMGEKLAEVIGEVRGGAEALTGASQQVSATAQALSQGTGEQAASVEETTSSLEEMSASITQ